MRLDQASRVAIMNWQQFNIAPNELVRIIENGTDAAMLARVTGGNPSELLGRLQADGKLFLINPQGVLVGPGAMIDTAAFLASTLDVADADFLKQGALTFKGDSDASVVNLGKIIAHEGNVVLLARSVKNNGELAAANGSVGLGAGSEVYLASPDAPTFIVKANLSSMGTTAVGVENTGVITAAQAQLEAAGGSIYDLAVNHSGVVRVTGVERQPDGRVLITAAGGNVSVSGSAVARSADGSGGEILVGGDYRGGNAEVANADRTHVGANAVLDASASSTIGDGGRVIVWADEATAFLGSLDARAGAQGGDGGFAEVSGKHSLAFDGAVDLSAPAGKRGELLLDPDNITIVAGTTTLPDALTESPYVWFETNDPGDQTIGADSVANLLLNNSVSLHAADTLTVNALVTVASGGANSVSLTLSAPTLAINESVSLANVVDGRLQFNGGGSAGSLTSAADATLAADLISFSGFPIVALNGALSADQMIYEHLQQTATSLIATHPDNAIGNLTLVSDRADPQPVNYSSNVSVHSGSPMSVTALIGSANNVTLSSAGDLTLLATDESGFMPATTINAAGEVRLASIGGVLINEAGSGLLEGFGRRLLYTSNTGGAFTLGGLSGYTQFDGVSFPNDPQGMTTLVLYNAAGAGPVLTLTITANDFARLYGQPNPVFTASFSGGTSADLTLQPTFSIQGGPAVNVGTYTIVPSGAASDTHNIQYVNGTLRIDPAVLTYVANPASRLYGDMNPVFGGYVTGFVNGDTLASATTGTLTFESFATERSDAGIYGIYGGGLSANQNYIFEQALPNNSALTIDRAPLTVTVGNATRRYGSADPQFDAAITGFRNGDTASVLTSFGLISNSTASSPVGAYEIIGGGSARNYVLNVLPGTLTITPAPLTLEGLMVSSVFGNTHRLGYRVSGLLNGDTPDVLSGVMLDRAFFDTTAPGVYSYGFSRTGTAQNYEVIGSTPGSLTIGRRVITGQVNDARSTRSAIPDSFAATFTPPLFGGPQFTIEGTLTQTAGLGQYTLTPVIKPLGRATLAEIERYYTFDLRPGTLTVDQDEIKFIFDFSTLQDQLTKVDIDQIELAPKPEIRVVHNLSRANPLTPYDLAEAARDFGPDLPALVPGLLEGEAAKDFTGEQVQLLEQVRDGKLTFAELGLRMRNDPAAASAIMPLLSQAVFAAVESGKELTGPQQALVARLANRVNEQRQILKEELKNQLREFQEQKVTVGANNPYALKTMPDIAISAQQAATQRALGAAFGAAGGLVLGGAVVGAIYGVGAGAIAPFAHHVGTALATVGGSAGAIIGVAVAVVVIGVQAAIMVAQEQQNKDAYSAMMDRANTRTDAKLTGLDLKNDPLAKAEFLNAFTMAMLETGQKK